MNLIVTQFADNELDTSDTVGNRAFLSNLLVRTASLTLRTTVCGLPKCRIAETSDLSRNFLAAFWQTAVMRMCRLV